MRMRSKKGTQPARTTDPTALPADLALCLDTATVIPRHSTEDGLRAIVQIDSRGWVHDPETTTAQLLRRWPALNEGQLRRAVRMVDAMVRRVAVPAPTERKRSWALNW